MTSFAFILGVLPLVRATGAGCEMRRALGVAVFSGMIGVTFFGLFFTPIFYWVVRWVTDKMSRKHAKELPRTATPQLERPAAPTVEPAPILAASNVEKISPALNSLPATKKSPLLRTRRERITPKAIIKTA